jgi:hypothetical protein
MNKLSLLLALCLPGALLAGCTLVFAEGEADGEPRRVAMPDAGSQGDAGASGSEGGAASSEGGATGSDGGAPANAAGQGGEPAAAGAGPGAQGGAGSTEVEGLGASCDDASSCSDSAPACPSAAGYCTFYCDEAWVNGWQAVPEKVEQCEALGGSCTEIGEVRSYCVP